MTPEAERLSFAEDGAMRLDCAALPFLAKLDALAVRVPMRGGDRLFDGDALRPLLGPDGPVGRIAADFLNDGARPVRAILFDKTPATNWALGWHQDRTIAVAARKDMLGYGPWTRKAGIHMSSRRSPSSRRW